MFMYTIGVDEVGRGPIAGPVVVCACAVQESFDILSLFPKQQLKDSKKLSEKVRDVIVKKIEEQVSAGTIVYAFGELQAEVIDTRGLAQAMRDVVSQALHGLEEQGLSKSTKIFLDGSLHAGGEYNNQETIIKGDEKIGEIALASIIAKVYRDRVMKDHAKKYTEYGFENHVGYGTKAHYEAIQKYGVTPLHRKSFLKNIL